MKLLFVTPIVSKRYATDWDVVTRGLLATLRSLHCQTFGSWKILYIGSELPDISSELMDKVLFLKKDLDIDRPEEKGRREIDKQRKQYCGYVEAQRLQPEFIMPLDYDDLVSTRLVEYVSNHTGTDGFVLKSGYIYRDGSNHCHFSRRIYMRTGSNVIIRFRPDLFPKEESDFTPPPPHYLEWPFIASHIKFPQEIFIRLGLSFREIPFSGVVWRRNSQSISNAFSQSNNLVSSHMQATHLTQLVNYTKHLLLRRQLSRRLCEEFGCEYGSGFGSGQEGT